MMQSRPLILFSLSFLGGVLGGLFAPFLGLVIFISLLAVSTLLFSITHRPQWKRRSLVCAFVVLGGVRSASASLLAPNDLSHLAPGYFYVTGVVESEVEERTGVFPFAILNLRAISVESSRWERPIPVSGGVRVSLGIGEEKNVKQKDSTQRLPKFGDKIQLRGALERPEGVRNPGGFDNEQFLERRGIRTAMRAKRQEDWKILEEGGKGDTGFLRAVFALRQAILNHSKQAFSEERSSALNGILLGERAALSPSLRDDFERTGTVHILATAGLHTGLVVAMLIGFLRLFRCSRKAAAGVAIPMLILFAIMAEGRPSVLRAVIIASVYLLARITEREPDMWNALAFAALLITLWNPYELLDAGFALSFSTVISLLVWMPIAHRGMLWAKKKIRGARLAARLARFSTEYLILCFAVALVAQIGALPLVAYYYHTVSLVSVPANMTTVPLVAPVIGLGFSAALFGVFSTALAAPLDSLLNLLLGAIIGLTQGWGRVGYGALSCPSLPSFLIVLYYAVLWGAGWRWEKRLLGRKTTQSEAEETES